MERRPGLGDSDFEKVITAARKWQKNYGNDGKGTEKGRRLKTKLMDGKIERLEGLLIRAGQRKKNISRGKGYPREIGCHKRRLLWAKEGTCHKPRAGIR